MNGSNIEISVIIPIYKDWDRLKLCLRNLAKQTYPIENFEVIIVNNDPNDICPYQLPTSNMYLISESKPGSYAARNTGIEKSVGDILAFTDSDCVPRIDWLREGVKKLKSNSSIYRVAGQIELLFKAGKLSFAETYEKAFAFRQLKFVKEEGTCLTANMLTYRNVFYKVGVFNDALFSGGDKEWGRRAEDQGFSIAYADKAIVDHPARSTIRELTRKIRRTRGGIYQISKLENKTRRFWVLRGLMPPILALGSLRRMNHLNFIEKMIAFLVLYYLKIITTACRLSLELEVTKPARE